MKRISLSIASIPILAVFGACSSSSGTGAAPAGSSSSNAGHLTSSVDGSLSDAAPIDGGAGDEPDAASDTTPYTATLLGAQVVPPIKTAAQGTAQLTLLADGVTLQYQISATGLSSAVTSVNFHVGSAVDTGGISHQIVLGADASTSGGSLTQSGTISLSSSNPDEVDALPIGQLYIDISTVNYPGGEIRGQIVSPGSTVLVANLTGGQEVPPVSSVYAAAAAFVLSADESTIQYHLSPGANLTETTISGISYGTAIGGEPINQGAVTGLGTTTDGTIDVEEATPWLNAEEWVNITTQLHQTGEIRGQILYPGETLFTSTLELTPTAQEAGSSTQGGAQVILDPSQTGVRYEVDTTSGNLADVFLKIGGFPGTPTGGADAGSPAGDGGVLDSYQLTIVGTEATNANADQAADASAPSLPLSAGDVAELQAGNAWILVETNSYMNGELQGVLTEQ